MSRSSVWEFIKIWILVHWCVLGVMCDMTFLVTDDPLPLGATFIATVSAFVLVMLGYLRYPEHRP